MNKLELSTERLFLRPYKIDDAKDVAKYCSNQKLSEFTLNIPYPYSEKDAIDWIIGHEELIKKGVLFPFAVILKSNNQLVGTMSLIVDKPHRRGELAYWIGFEHWSKGYGTESGKEIIKHGFNNLGLNRIAAHHFTENPASGKIMQKLGMNLEGTMKERYLKRNQFFDTDHYAILKRDCTYL